MLEKVSIRKENMLSHKRMIANLEKVQLLIKEKIGKTSMKQNGKLRIVVANKKERDLLIEA
ncbi:hypothetical protein CN568_22460 [Bacillus pseudomycoides]|uniref:Uncharacterized protein n=1 Tax=Bacillus pseudomycoides TaxID=64104 RepID=A0AAJ2DLS9_9BACI|nr:hypothetical protein [Bacillus pseudomycoides]PDZ08450.1 hypothetical protein CON70_27705 [Bacillus pseudomycoides]PDZ71153.1 hypothetical protein CON58_24715 [Bacillus pseudomycoides]PEJ26780.1 hypothetical protein CN887_07170 [Bacillus pseudomycoides]PEK30199.1 hypothetical protein CN691_20240 [Bacillus pseudomycoides]